MKLLSKILRILKLDLSKTEDKLKLFILVSGLLIFIGVFSVSAIQFTMRPAFCSTCHNMTPEYVTWQSTSHANIACTDCHIPPGVGNLIIHKVEAMKELYLYFTNSYETPLKMTSKIENSQCEQCHSIETRNFTTSGDLIIPHLQHLNSKLIKVYCVDCHAGVVHGKVAERGATATENKATALHDGDLNAWTLADGKAQTAVDFTKPDMDTCIACHVKVSSTVGHGKPSIKCETCHSTIKTPDNHSNKAQWLSQHGKDAEKDINVCKSCHSYGMKVNKVQMENTAAAYAWGNSFCRSCHSQPPATHKRADWRQTHRFDVQKKGPTNCQACHNLSTTKYAVNPPASKTCAQCH